MVTALLFLRKLRGEAAQLRNTVLYLPDVCGGIGRFFRRQGRDHTMAASAVARTPAWGCDTSHGEVDTINHNDTTAVHMTSGDDQAVTSAIDRVFANDLLDKERRA